MRRERPRTRRRSAPGEIRECSSAGGSSATAMSAVAYAGLEIRSHAEQIHRERLGYPWRFVPTGVRFMRRY